MSQLLHYILIIRNPENTNILLLKSLSKLVLYYSQNFRFNYRQFEKSAKFNFSEIGSFENIKKKMP